MPTAIPLSISTLLKQCHELELLMGAIYTTLADAHASHPRVALLWSKTAREETNHASQFKLAMAIRGDLITKANVDGSALDAALVEAKDFLLEVDNGAPKIEESLRRAVRLEEQMAEFHLHLAVTFDSPSHQKLFRAMMAADKGHVESLQAELTNLLSEQR